MDLVKINGLIEEIRDSLDEANPYHDVYGRFTDKSGAKVWSLGGRRMKITVKKGRTFKTPIRGRVPSEMSGKERKRAVRRSVRRSA